MDLNSIRQSAQPSFFDAIENIKGVQMITPSLGFKVINAGGFTNTTNVRFVTHRYLKVHSGSILITGGKAVSSGNHHLLQEQFLLTESLMPSFNTPF
jgi:hypothetical protein